MYVDHPRLEHWLPHWLSTFQWQNHLPLKGVAVAENEVIGLIPQPYLLHPKVSMRRTRNPKIAPKDTSLLCECGALWPSLSQINSPFNIYICRRICIIVISRWIDKTYVVQFVLGLLYINRIEIKWWVSSPAGAVKSSDVNSEFPPCSSYESLTSVVINLWRLLLRKCV